MRLGGGEQTQRNEADGRNDVSYTGRMYVAFFAVAFRSGVSPFRVERMQTRTEAERYDFRDSRNGLRISLLRGLTSPTFLDIL